MLDRLVLVALVGIVDPPRPEARRSIQECRDAGIRVRMPPALDRPLVAVQQDTEQHGAVLLHRTRASGLLMAVGMDHLVTAPGAYDEETDVRSDWARTTVVTALRPGERPRITKFLGYAARTG